MACPSLYKKALYAPWTHTTCTLLKQVLCRLLDSMHHCTASTILCIKFLRGRIFSLAQMLLRFCSSHLPGKRSPPHILLFVLQGSQWALFDFMLLYLSATSQSTLSICISGHIAATAWSTKNYVESTSTCSTFLPMLQQKTFLHALRLQQYTQQRKRG